MPVITRSLRLLIFLGTPLILWLQGNVAVAQSPTLPFQWAWRDYPFADSLRHIQELEVMRVDDQQGGMTSFHWVRLDSMGRAVDEIYLEPGDALVGMPRRFHWEYDSVGCPERHILVGGTLQAHPSSRYSCKEGLLIDQRCERRRSFAILQYGYEFSSRKPDFAVVFAGATAGPREPIDTMHYRYDTLQRLVGYRSQWETFKIQNLDAQLVAEKDEVKGPLTTVSYWPVEHGIPDRLFVERRGYRRRGWEERYTVHLRALWR